MRLLAIVACAALGLALILGGTAPLARVLLAAGFPGAAAQLFEDPGWRGVARYRAGEYDAAVEAFSRAGALYNLGNAEARRGNYAGALEAYDIAIARGDADAQANFDVVAAFYANLGIDPETLALYPKRQDGPETEGFVARGKGRAAGTGDDVTNTNTMMGLAQLDSRGNLGVRRIFDDRFMVADERWLQQLSDVPGEFLAARIAAEHKRRAKLGLAPPPAEDPR